MTKFSSVHHARDTNQPTTTKAEDKLPTKVLYLSARNIDPPLLLPQKSPISLHHTYTTPTPFDHVDIRRTAVSQPFTADNIFENSLRKRKRGRESQTNSKPNVKESTDNALSSSSIASPDTQMRRGVSDQHSLSAEEHRLPHKAHSDGSLRASKLSTERNYPARTRTNASFNTIPFCMDPRRIHLFQ